MAATNYTPISLYYSATASATPTAGNLVAGELAINTNDGKLFYKDSSGVVQVLATKGGVGTSSTTQVLYNSSGLVVGSAGLTFDGTNLATTGTATATRFIPSGSTIATNGLYLPAANNLGFSTNSTERMRIDSSGNVLIGVSSSSYDTYNALTLQNMSLASFSNGDNRIVGNAYYQSPNWKYQNTAPAVYQTLEAASGFFIWSRAPSGTAGTNITWSELMRLDTSGNLLVGTTSAAGAKLNINGSSSSYCGNFTAQNGYFGISVQNTSGTAAWTPMIFFTNATTVGTIGATSTATSYNTSSDYRLKENIQPMAGALATIAQLKPVTYNWKVDGSDGQGFIAHELQAVVPDCVTGEKDAIDEDGNPKYQGVDTSFLVATLTAAIQEQQALIESLTTRLTALESK
jgi:hypothetical protein